jgi:hypothetical protein
MELVELNPEQLEEFMRDYYILDSYSIMLERFAIFPEGTLYRLETPFGQYWVDRERDKKFDIFFAWMQENAWPNYTTDINNRYYYFHNRELAMQCYLTFVGEW